MTAPVEPESEFEIAHVLCTDIVGYSKLTIDQQSEYLRKLNDVVRSTEQFQRADASGKLLRIPTGDGMVLVFFTHPQDPAECAVQIAQRLKAHPEIQLRMGVHSGPVNRVSDVNERSNVAGAGINIGQRVMDCGEAGHILLSKRVAEDLGHYSKWRPHLHELGEFEVKHGVKIDIVNLYTDEVGNSATPEKLKKGKVVSVATSKKSLLATAFLAAIALAIGFWFFPHRTAQRSPTVSAGSPAPVPEKSIAILPFKPLSSQNRDEILEAGMADTLIAKLSTIREIIIPSLTSARKYDDQEHDPLAAGRLLHVRSVLEGTLQKVADRIRVTARLINVADGASMWTGTFDEKFTDVFAVQDAIAQKVAEALALRLSGEEQKRLTKRYTENTEAYQLYLKGRFYWNKWSEDGFRKSIEYFKQAVEKDPNYALAYSGMADAYSLLCEWGSSPSNEIFPQARGYAEKALKLDDTLSEAHLSIGIVKLLYDWDFAEADKELRRAKELDPKDAQVYHFYGHYLELLGRFDEAAAETKRGIEFDPTNLVINSELGLAYYWGHKFEQAAAQHRKTLEMDSSFTYASFCLALDYIQMRKYKEALAELNRARPISQDWSWIVAGIGYIDGLLGKRAEAQKIIDELTARSTREYIDPVLIAFIYIPLGDKDQAFAWMEKGYQERSGQILWLKVEPLFDPLRSDPRFDDLVRRMGLK
jgi:TolB-like protein/Tfp pilus assembly protein PilF/class 3 adenylate cyclase